jgi:hypothetical protein
MGTRCVNVSLREDYEANFPGRSISFYDFKEAAFQRVRRYLR